ncbi:MAG: di-heme oxidoredictase family protein [Thermodesulfobacteriota bacterium]
MYNTNYCDLKILQSKYLLLFAPILLAVLFIASCDSGPDTGYGTGTPGAVEPAIPAGGDTSINNRTSFAFEVPAPNLTPENLERHLDGDIEFGNVFVTEPAPVNPGLGPLFNNVSCESCHLNNGRGLPEFGNTALRSLSLVRVSDPNGVPTVPGGNPPVEGLGNQIQDHAIFGVDPEAEVTLDWEEVPGSYPDGSAFSLRKPLLTIILANGEPLDESILTSVRMPPPVFGLGLLEAIPDETILSMTDPDDADGDGISGRVNMVWDRVSASTKIGRFGLKANNPTLRQQTANAYAGDMGVSSPDLSDEDLGIDITQEQLDLATFYVQSLAVPNRLETDDPDVQKGEQFFYGIGCNSCHVSTLETGQTDIQEVSNQKIQAFTDLLLHDMGEGLADNRPDFLANGREWRTAPLWGIGLTQRVLGVQNFLHDGRARTLEEAILWHGGEAEATKNDFMNLSAKEREQLIDFLNTL